MPKKPSRVYDKFRSFDVFQTTNERLTPLCIRLKSIKIMLLSTEQVVIYLHKYMYISTYM